MHKKLELELIEIEEVGVCIRFSPLEHVNVIGTTQQDIENFSQSLYDIIVGVSSLIFLIKLKIKQKFDSKFF